MVKFVAPTTKRLRYIADHMRDEDVAEVWASNNHTPWESIDVSMSMTDWAVVIEANGIPLAVLGLRRANMLTGSGVPWLLSSEDALDHKRSFLELTGPVIQEMLDKCPRLVNYVHVENKLSVRWLKWLGFKLDDPVMNPATGAMFRRFHMER